LTISVMNWMRMVRCLFQIYEALQWQNQDSNSLNGSTKTGLSDSCDTLKLSGTVHLVPEPITREELLLMRSWFGHASNITLSILPRQAHWPIGSIQAAAQ
jgi:hypothetical protein